MHSPPVQPFDLVSRRSMSKVRPRRGFNSARGQASASLKLPRICSPSGPVVASLLALASCAADLAVKQSVADVRPLAATGGRLSMQVRPCTNRTEYVAREIGREASEALLEKLKATGEFDVSSGGRYVVSCDISTFVEGSALKRWLMPGWGATTGQVAVMVMDSTTGETVAIVRGHATVAAGGLYSVDADKIILASALEDVVRQLRLLAAGALPNQ